MRRPSRPRRSATARPGLVSSLAAPVLLVGGWTVAAGRQSGSFDPVERTISDLAALGADDRWVMTAALAGLGACHVTTALSLRDAATPGRVVLAAGGVATVLVAVFPLPADGTGSVAHTAVATTAFAALSAWPALAARRSARPVPLRPLPAALATGTLAGCLVWFGLELKGGDAVGLAERVTAGLQSLWPLAAAWGGLLASRRTR